MAERWIVWGAGGHGAVVADAIVACGDEVVGFADVFPQGSDCIEERLLLEALQRLELPLGATRLALGIGANQARERAWRRLPPGIAPPVIHPSAWCSPGARIASGAVVLPQAVVQPRASVGEAAIVNSGAIVEHDCVLGFACHVSPGAVLTGGVHVGPRAWVGARAVILPRRRIGGDAIVGAGAVVTRDVAPGVTVVGSPARQLEGKGQ
jgi:UDP-N-acetylbacillosamine N-acetyltransferase